MDLGQTTDFTALAILERPLVERGVPRELRRPAYALRHLKRFPLGTSYPQIVQTVVKLIQTDMSVEDGVEFFANEPSIARKIGVLDELGLGYLKLGHPSTILSGGEAQRVKLAGELGKLKRSKHNLYILDEPTTGLHFADIDRLLQSLNRLVDNGHSVVVIEHNLDVIKTADHVIDLGPEGGHKGGQLIACGTPEEIAACKASHTGKFLARLLRT